MLLPLKTDSQKHIVHKLTELSKQVCYAYIYVKYLTTKSLASFHKFFFQRIFGVVFAVVQGLTAGVTCHPFTSHASGSGDHHLAVRASVVPITLLSLTR